MRSLSEARFGLLAACLVAIFAVSLAIQCPVSTCSIDDPNLPSMWMNTSSMSSKLTGLSFILYPNRRNGEAFMGAYAELNITDVQELQPLEAGDRCETRARDPGDSGAYATVLRVLEWDKLCCEISMDWDMLEPTINRTTARVKVSDPDDPEFKFELAFSLVNESISYRVPGTPNTDNEDFFISYSDVATKLNIEMSNWPWVGKNLTDGYVNPSYLKFFLIGFGAIEEIGNITVWDKGLSTFYSASTYRSYVELNFLKVVNLDGVDYALSLGAEDPITAVEVFDYVGAPLSITGCQNKRIIGNPYWTNFTYDPTLTALYDDSDVSTITTPEQAAKRRLPVVAYVVPIAIVVVVLAVVFVVIFVTPVNNFFFGDRSKVLRTGRSLDDHNTKEPARFTQPAPAASAAEPSAPAADPRGSWVRSTKIDH